MELGPAIDSRTIQQVQTAVRKSPADHKLVATVVKKPLSEVPIVALAAMAQIPIRLPIIAYSIAVIPSLSRARLDKILHIDAAPKRLNEIRSAEQW
jgi:hypothetical protein